MNKLGVVVLISLLSSAIPAVARNGMTYRQYETELANCQLREKNAKEQIAVEQARIENLKRQIADLDIKISALKQEIYRILGIAEADVVAAENEIGSIRGELELLDGLPIDDFRKRIGDIGVQESRILALKKKKVSLLWRVRDLIPPVERLFEQVKAKAIVHDTVAVSPKQVLSYTVRLIPGKRDCLYRIAAYDSIYGDPVKWPMLYRANESIIKKQYERYSRRNPSPKYSRPEDLIYPGQALDIPR